MISWSSRGCFFATTRETVADCRFGTRVTTSTSLETGYDVRSRLTATARLLD